MVPAGMLVRLIYDHDQTNEPPMAPHLLTIIRTYGFAACWSSFSAVQRITMGFGGNRSLFIRLSVGGEAAATGGGGLGRRSQHLFWRPHFSF